MKIKEILDKNVVGNIEIDYYVPVTVEYENNDNKNGYIYYSTKDGKNSFVEITLNSYSKKITRIIILTIKTIKKIPEKDLKKFEVPCIQGNPIIDNNDDTSYQIIDEAAEFFLFLGEKKLYAVEEKIDIAYKIKMNPVELLIDPQNNVCGYIFYNFSEDEWRELNEIIDEDFSKGIIHKDL